MVSLPSSMRTTIPPRKFVVTEAEAAAIRAVFEQSGEFSAAVELRRLFPTATVTDTAQARACARTIAVDDAQDSRPCTDCAGDGMDALALIAR